MRRSTRSSAKRAPLPPDSSEEDEPKKTKPEHKSNKTAKLEKISQEEENSNNESDIESEASEKEKPNQEENSDSSSGDSDIENYLQPVDQIDFNSTFFKVAKPEGKKSFEDIESNIFSGINRLSDSESEHELEETKNDNVSAKEAETKVDSTKATTSKINFQQLHDYATKIEEAKKLVEKYEARKRAKQKYSAKQKSEGKLDISDLLALGETKLNAELQNSIHSSDFESHSDSEKEDWEEVEQHDVEETNESIIPKDGVQISLELPGGAIRKKKGIDLITCMKRRLNRIKRENQVYVHKVHLLCWLGHGNYVNQILNNENILGLALSLIPSQHCYPSKRTDLSYLEQIVKWYKNSIPNVNKSISKEMTLEKALKVQINRKQAFNKKMLVYIFICILRSLGIQCRLVVSFQVALLRPPSSELHSLSTKSEDKSDKDPKPSTSRIDSSQNPSNTKANKDDKSKTKKQQEIKEEKSKKPNLGNLSSKDYQKYKNKNEKQNENKLVRAKDVSIKPNLKTVTNKIDKTNKSDKEMRKPHQLEKKHQKSKNKIDSNLKQNKDYSQASTSNKKKCSVNDTIIHTQKSHNFKIHSKEYQNKTDTQVSDASYNLTSKTDDSESKHNELSALKISQVDGADDSDNEPTTSQKSKKPNLKKLSQEEANPCLIKKHPKRLKSKPNCTVMDSDKDFKSQTPKQSTSNNIQSSMQSNSKSNLLVKLKKLKYKSAAQSSKKDTHTKGSQRSSNTQNQISSSSTSLKKLKQISNSNKEPWPSKSLDRNKSQYFSQKLPTRQGDIRNDIISIMKGRMVHERAVERSKLVKSRKARTNESDYDSDYAAEPINQKHVDSDDEFYEKNKVKVKQRVKVKKDEDEETKIKKGSDVWVEVYLETEEKWISADVIKGKVHCIKELYSRASHPVTYIVAWNNDNSIKDITQRYCPNWNTVTRKLRIDKKWWEDSLKPFEGRKTARDREEDEELARLQLDQPLPTTISEYKNHPLYVIKRHILKFEALYPSDPITLGFVRGEAVYSRECVHTLHSREVWIKYAKVVKPEEEPYKIVKARSKYDKLSGQAITDKPLELFGKWQVTEYVPPTAENGIVPRNAYGNVELFKARMLPKGTVHLQLPGLNKLARKMNIDCASAVVGFDFHSGGSHPTFDGFVVCEEYSEVLIAAWYLEQEEQEQKQKEKTEKRIYGNWKKLIKGLLIRERLKARYNFGGPSQAETTSKKRQSKEPKLKSKKRKLYSDSDSD